MKAELVLVAAVAENGVIGRDNRLIWRLKTDLRHFRDLTIGRPVIMGRKTYESIGKPLPGRQVVVVTRQPDLAIDGVTVARSIDQALAIGERLAAASGVREVISAGGGDIYAATIGKADRLEITRVKLEVDGDAHFPPIEPSDWRLISSQDHPAGPDDEAAFSFLSYRRR